MFASSHLSTSTRPLRNAALCAYHIMRVPGPVAGIAESPSGRARMLPPGSREISGGTTTLAGSGRGYPGTGVPVSAANAPDVPPGPRHVPLSVLSAIVASSGDAVPPGAVTTFRPRQIGRAHV